MRTFRHTLKLIFFSIFLIALYPTSAQIDTTNSAVNSSVSNTSARKFTSYDTLSGRQARNFLNNQTFGTISSGYEYGIIPFGPSPASPMGYFSSQGSCGVSSLGMPLTVNYYYSTLKNIAGLNNYFRVSFDPAKYRHSLQENAYKKIEQEKKKLSHLLDLQQQLQQKIAYQQLASGSLPSKEILNVKLDTLTRLSRSYTLPQPDSLLPSLNSPVSNPGKLNPYLDSINQVRTLLARYDSITSTVDKLKASYNQMQRDVQSTRNKLEYLQNPQQVLSDNNPYQKKIESILSGVKALEVGLCYPNHSTFLVNGSTIKGINLEWEKKIYFALTYGKTINTLLTTNNLIQNQLQTGQNLYNFFDFGNVKDTRKIVAVKTGIGEKDGTHLHFGLLYGYGLTSYLNPSMAEQEKNIVIELDGKWLMTSNHAIDLVYGKSALYHLNSENDGSSHGTGIFSASRSNAILSRYTGQFFNGLTKVIVTGRLVDPFFKSYGVGFMRSDNFRSEIKVEQRISKAIKLSAFYRKDRNNLLNLYPATSSLQCMGFNASVRINKRLNARLIYSPVIQNIMWKDSASVSKPRLNQINTASITYTPRLGKVLSTLNLLINYYQLSGNTKSSYQSYSLINTTTFGRIKSEANASYFYNNSGDSLNNTSSFAYSASCMLKKVTITMGIKYANNTIAKNQIGGIIQLNLPLIEHISFEAQATRLVVGDFYNYYNTREIQKFPYNLQGKLIINW